MVAFDKIYCLHMAEAGERYSSLLDEINRVGLEVDIWWTCGRKISSIIGTHLNGLKTSYYEHMRRFNEDIYKGVFNCAFEHYTIIKQAYLRGFNNILIMEDDIRFIDDVDKVKRVFSSMPDDYDVIKFYSSDMIDMGEGFHVAQDGENIYSTLCYALSRQGMRKYIELMDKSFVPADVVFERFDSILVSNAVICHPNDVFRSYITGYFAKPLLSIIIPCFNASETIKEAIDSVKAINYDNWECIIVNDGSTDDSDKVIKANVDGRFKVVTLMKNGGVANARNIALFEAKGEYVICLDADDIIYPDYPKNAMLFMSLHPDYDLYFGNMQLTGYMNGLLKLKWEGYKEMLKPNFIGVNACYKRERAIVVGGYDTSLRAFEDYEFYLRYLNEESKVMAADEIMIEYRTREESRHNSVTQDEKNKILSSIIRKYVQYIKTNN